MNKNNTFFKTIFFYPRLRKVYGVTSLQISNPDRKTCQSSLCIIFTVLQAPTSPRAVILWPAHMNIYLIQPLTLLSSILQQTIINTNLSPDPSLQLQEVVVGLDDPDVVSPVVPSLGPHHSLVNRIELLGSPLSDLHPLLRLLGGLHDSEEVVHVGLLRPHHSHVGTEAGGAFLTIPLVAAKGISFSAHHHHLYNFMEPRESLGCHT